jgi:ribosome-associated protein
MDSARKARSALVDKKAGDPVILDVRTLSTVTDFHVLVTGNNAPHIKALAEQVEKAMKEAGTSCYRRSGTPESGWVVADFLDVVVHIFAAETRSYFALEQLWNDAPRVE